MESLIDLTRLRERQAELELIADAIPVLVSYVGKDKRYRRVNRRYQEFFGREEADFLGRSIPEIVGAEYYSAALPNILRALSGERVSFVSRLADAEGSQRDLHVTYIPDISPEGDVRGFVTMAQDVTEQNRAIRALEESERRLALREHHLRVVLDSIPECVKIVGHHGELLDINAAGLELMEAPSREQAIGRDLYGMVEDGLRPAFVSLIRNALLGEPYGALEYRATGLRGTERLIETRAVPLRDDAGQVSNALCVTRDISARKVQEAALREANERLAAIFKSSPLPIVVFDRQSEVTAWNPASERIFGWTEEEVLGKPLPFIPADKQEEHHQMKDRDFRGESFSGVEVRRCRKDGSPIDLSISTAPLRDSSGQITAIIALYADVTTQRRTEQELRVNEARFRALVEQSPFAKQILSLDGRVLGVNKAWERLWGAFENRPPGLNGFEDPQLAEAGMLPYLLRAREGCAVEIPELPVQSPGISDGEMIWIQGAAYPVRDGNGTVREVVAVLEDVTARRRAEEALRESENTSRVLMQSLPTLVWTAEPSGNVTFVNQSWLEYTGQSFEQTLGLGWLDVLHPEDREQTLSSWRKALQSGEPYETRQRIRRYSDGQLRWHLVRAFPLRDTEGRILRWLGSSTDTHDEIDAAERLAFALDAAHMGDWSWDAGTDVVTMSERAAEMFGIPAGPFMTWTEMQKLLHADDAELARAEVIRTIEQRTDYDVEYRVGQSSQDQRWVAAKGRAIYASDGVHGMVGVVQDITARKRAEEERRDLLTSEQRARQIAEQLNAVGMMFGSELDPQRLTQTITDVATRLTGAAFGAFFHNVVGTSGESYMLYTLSGVPREAFSQLAMPRKTELFGPTFRGEGVVRSADILQDPRYGKSSPYQGMPPGHLPVRSYLAVPVVARDGEVLGGLFFGHPEAGVFNEEQEKIVRGIAGQASIALDNARLLEEAQRVRADLQLSNAELRSANADLEQFAYSASHDLQEPLRMVSIYCQILGRNYRSVLDERGRECLEFAIQGAKRMEALLHDLLEYTRAANAAKDFRRESIAVDGALDQALSNLKSVIRDQKARIERFPLPVVPVDPMHLMQLFQNLIGNALKYRSADSPVIRIWAEREQSHWKFCVEDNGIGVPPEYSRQIFGLFRRLHAREQYEGTGIGLAICQKIVERYAGHIWVEPTPAAQGSRFCFTLPAGKTQP